MLRRFYAIPNKLFGRSMSLHTEVKQNCCVWISKSHDIYSNLALEEWIYDHIDLENKSIFLLWRNKPCIVIGRHQNPWEECNLPLVQLKDVCYARRQSGGGTVYHDLGNLCCSFFTNRSSYNRNTNLTLAKDVLVDDCNLNVSISSRDDLLLDDKFKVCNHQ